MDHLPASPLPPQDPVTPSQPVLTGKSYFWLFGATAAAVALATYILLFISHNLTCNTGGYRDGNFMAYCYNHYYADYEHGAYYFDLEPGLKENVRASELLFLGDSSALTAFSGKPLLDMLNGMNIPFHILGFAYNEHKEFMLQIMRGWALQPKMIVINANAFFFEDGASDPGNDVLSEARMVKWHYIQLRWFQQFQRPFCKALPGLCDQKATSIFRSVKDGHWEWEFSYPPLRAYFDPAKQLRIPDELVERHRGNAKKFVDFLLSTGIKPACIVFTGVPHGSGDMPDMAARLGAGLGVTIINPAVPPLASFDDAHLDPRSVQIWSAAFAKAVKPTLTDCLGQQAAP